MVAVPSATPDTTPVLGSMGAIAGLLLVQVPPGMALLSEPVVVMHTSELPVMAAGASSTVTLVLAKQPAAMVYRMLVVPASTPVAMPVPRPMVATPGIELVHVPPGTVLLSVAAEPSHRVAGPVMAVGNGVTVKGSAAKQPVGSV